MIETLTAGDVALMGVPLDMHSSFLQGPAFAPGRIREALHNGAATLTAEDGTDLGSPPRLQGHGRSGRVRTVRARGDRQNRSGRCRAHRHRRAR